MSVNINYKNNSIAALTDTGTKTLKTAGKYCEADIIVENTKDGGGATEPYVEETYDSSGNLTSAALHGHSVVRRAAFYDCETLTSVTFNGTPSSISSNAFDSCSNLTTINVPWAEGAVSGAPWG